ncbi:MAG: diguanylate cyclase [Rhodoferax sp.]
MSEKKPFEIARETLKQLTARKLVPTPLNYQNIYNEIAGIPQIQAFPSDTLREIVRALPVKTPGQQRQKGLLESAVERMSWESLKTALIGYGGFASSDADTDSARPVSAPALTQEFFAQIARLIDFARPALGEEDDRFVAQTDMLLKAMRQSQVDAVAVKLMLAQYADRLAYNAEDQAEIKKTLLKLLHLVFENIAELSVEEQWLKGQMEALMGAAQPPLSLRRLDEVERRLRDVIFKQKDAKGRMLQAQDEMRQMLATFVDRLSEMSQSTGSFQSKLEESARAIESARSLEEIAPVLKEVVNATRAMAEQSEHSNTELQAMREHAAQAQTELAKLHQELDRVSAQARHDPLTGALNRKGLDEAAEREMSTMRRKSQALCVALLDIDNFKQLNDRLGHDTGDEALKHLAGVARQCMRPQDTLARYGGEEFVILLPDTEQPHAIEVMTRLQRELTTRFFMAGTEKILITFSAGVAQVGADEGSAEAIKRADQAMYLAKRAGKNRVVGG